MGWPKEGKVAGGGGDVPAWEGGCQQPCAELGGRQPRWVRRAALASVWLALIFLSLSPFQDTPALRFMQVGIFS